MPSRSPRSSPAFFAMISIRLDTERFSSSARAASFCFVSSRNVMFSFGFQLLFFLAFFGIKNLHFFAFTAFIRVRAASFSHLAYEMRACLVKKFLKSQKNACHYRITLTKGRTLCAHSEPPQI